MVDIRNACDDDIQGFVDCYSKIWKSFRGILPKQWVEEVIEEADQPAFSDNLQSTIAHIDHIILVAEDEGKIVGLAQGRIHRGGRSWLVFMGVLPDHRRQGIGGSLLSKFIEKSKQGGCTKVSLDTAPCLKPAIKLYVDNGFIPEGYLRRHSHGLDLIFYSKFLE